VVGHGRVVPLLALGAGFQPDLSGRENIFMNAALYGMAATDVEKRLDDIIEFAGIGDFIDVPVKRYSSGMYLRLAFSVAVNMNPGHSAGRRGAGGGRHRVPGTLPRTRQAGR
jgi:ABC-type polysaccharide/polyol phosphate transport system ATPase subunit